MESILVKHINMPQTSKHVRVQAADVAAAGTYTFDIVVPEGAIVEKANVVVKTAFDNGTSAAVQIGDINTVDSFLASTSIKSAARTESPAAKQMTAVTAYTATDDGEDNYVVRATVTTVGTAATAGDMYFWVDFRFAPNVAYS